MSLVAAHWELAERVVHLRNTYAPNTRIIGNGDVRDLADATEKADAGGWDGIMLGRAIFGNPWVFTGKELSDISREDRLAALLQLAEYFDELRPKKSFHILKKHFKAFVNGWPGAAELRGELMEAEDIGQLRTIITRLV
jgi:tRNA-dihydrouridine synthase